MNIGRRSFFQRLAALLAIPLLSGKIAAKLGLEDEPPVDLPTEDELWLAEWQAASRMPICDSQDPKERRLLRAMRLQEPVQFIYHGGTAPGEKRRVRPALLFRVEGYTAAYLTGYCEIREENRTFRLDRVQL